LFWKSLSRTVVRGALGWGRRAGSEKEARREREGERLALEGEKLQSRT